MHIHKWGGGEWALGGGVVVGVSTALRSKGAFTADVSTRTRGVRIEVLLIAVRGLPGAGVSSLIRTGEAGQGRVQAGARLDYYPGATSVPRPE